MKHPASSIQHRTSNREVEDRTRIHRTLVLAAFASFILLATSCQPNHSVADRLGEFGPEARARLRPDFERVGVVYPPKRVIYAAFKQEREFEVYAMDQTNQWHLVSTHPILGASGSLGPKLREGDRQVPEGIYPITELNPNSRYQVSLRVGYPNDFDRAQAAFEGRTNLGEDIMIHGGHGSIGCIAMGDLVSEELFVLAADTGMSNVTVVISPVDFRAGRNVPLSTNQPPWVPQLYDNIKAKLAELPKPQTLE